jgi:hypothetical protein
MFDSDELDDDSIVIDDDQSIDTDESLESDQAEAKAADLEDEDLDYSKKVQKRIKTVVQQRNIERDARAAAEAENARLRQELEEHRKSIAEKEIADLKQQKLDALAIEDHQAVVDIDEKIMDHKTRQNAAPTRSEPTQQQQTVKQSDALAEWQSRNKWVFEDTNPKTLKANQIYNKLLERGFDPDDPDTYAEIDKRMAREVPMPSGGRPDRGETSASSGGVVPFTPEDKALMVEFGLDPSNKAHRTQWAKSKKEAERG